MSTPSDEAELPRLLSAVAARMGAAVSTPLTRASDRVQIMASTGRIDRTSLLALGGEIEAARRAGMLAQQIARLAAGQAQPVAERLDLAQLLRDVLTEQAAHAAGAALPGSRQQLAPVTVLADASLVATLLRAAADWGQGLAQAPLEWRLDLEPWPVQARLVCVLVHQTEDQPAPDTPTVLSDGQASLAALDTLDWLMLRFAAHLAGVQVQRDDSPSRSVLTLRFPSTLADTVEGPGADPASAARPATRLLAGSQVLVLAARRDARQRVREALQGQDLFVDYVPSVAAAREYCDDGSPQMLVFESAFQCEALRQLCLRLDRQPGRLVLVEITPEGHAVEQDDSQGLPMTRLGAEALRSGLAPALAAALQRRAD